MEPPLDAIRNTDCLHLTKPLNYLPRSSPDGDGREDVLQIRLRSKEPANRLRIRIFHAGGVLVRELANGLLGGTEAIFSWNGLDEKGGRLPTGQYILLVEWNDKNGKQSREKKVLTLVNTR
ncbi:MAG: hypothetical protein FJX92_07765 [Bacteroidetes bacterium]|nr:hypothetical protein [Bacteroidota bacterium]